MNRRSAIAPAGRVDVRWLIATAVLFLNDHWAKARWPGWLTGKISDVAGLVVAPVAAATILTIAGLSARRARVVAAVVTAALFAAVKVAQPVSDAFFLRTGLGRVRADRTDLLALAILPLTWHILKPQRPTSQHSHRRTQPVGPAPVQRVALALACVVCLATGEPQERLAGTVAASIVPAPGGGQGVIVVAADAGEFVSFDDGGTWRTASESEYPVLKQLRTERLHTFEIPGQTSRTTVGPNSAGATEAERADHRACFDANHCVDTTATEIRSASGTVWSVDADARARVVGNLDEIRYGGRPLPGLGRPVTGATSGGPRVVVPYSPDRIVVGNPAGQWRVALIDGARPMPAGDPSAARGQLIIEFLAGLSLLCFFYLGAPRRSATSADASFWIALVVTLVALLGALALSSLDTSANLLAAVVLVGPIVVLLAGAPVGGWPVVVTGTGAVLAELPLLLWTDGTIHDQWVAILLTIGELAGATVIAWELLRRNRRVAADADDRARTGPSVLDGVVASMRADGLLEPTLPPEAVAPPKPSGDDWPPQHAH